MHLLLLLLHSFLLVNACDSYKILAIFPYNGRSHHIYFSSIVEELAIRGHNVTVINYFPVKKMSNLRQISLQSDSASDNVDMQEHLKTTHNDDGTSYGIKEFYSAYGSARAFKFIANNNCMKLVNNEEIKSIVKSNEKFDVVLVEQFVTDCGLALAHKLDGPIVGMTAHIMMPWTYSRLGTSNNPAFVPNHFFGTGSRPDITNRIKSALVNIFLNAYYTYVIQKSDYEILRKVYPETPELEDLGKNITLILLNQYFLLTGSRLYGANVIEVGGIHIKETNEISDKELEKFLDSAENGVVYVSFGTVAKNLPHRVLSEIIKVMRKSNMNFIWKVDDLTLNVPKNTLLRKWLPQPAILCHRKVLAFITHSGMLSSSEAMHCGVPIVSVPMFGDQFANAASAVEIELGVMVDLVTLDEEILTQALDIVLHKRYQNRAKQLSQLWRDRPLPPMDTAIFWIEYVAKHKTVNLKPPTVDLPLYQYLMLDVIFIISSLIFLVVYVTIKILRFLFKLCGSNKVQHKKKRS